MCVSLSRTQDLRAGSGYNKYHLAFEFTYYSPYDEERIQISKGHLEDAAGTFSVSKSADNEYSLTLTSNIWVIIALKYQVTITVLSWCMIRRSE